jgi:hypothetical protein
MIIVKFCHATHNIRLFFNYFCELGNPLSASAQKVTQQTLSSVPFWSSFGQELQVDRSSKYTVYKPAEITTTTLLLSIYNAVINKCLRGIATIAKDVISKKTEATDPTSEFEVEPYNCLDEGVVVLYGDSKEKTTLCSQMGATEQQFDKCLERAEELAKAFFAEKGIPVFNYSWEEPDFKRWLQEVCNEQYFDSLSYLDLERSEDPIQYTEEQLSSFGISEKSEISIEATNISCFAYALLLVGEIEARNVIFKAKSVNDPLKWLQKRNWQIVEVPQVGDLVVYLDDKDEPLHFGYYVGEGLVKSKFGNKCPFSCLHTFFNTPTEYGKRILFLRKSTAPIESSRIERVESKQLASVSVATN